LRSEILLLAILSLAPGMATAQPFGFGQPVSEAAIAGWNIDVRPDGSGLPPGRGSVAEGETVFQQSCAACHGVHGEGSAAAPGLAGGIGSLATAHPVRTVGSYWPYATTLFDYIRRAMPFNAPQSLSADQVYAVSAYVLHLNGLVDAQASLDAQTLPTVLMPNRDGFRPVYQAGR
jgi:cytochrome c